MISEKTSLPETPRVSVVVPVYKVEKYLAECVESVLAQTFRAFEIILVDDGSPDASGKICDEFSAKDSRVCVFHQENQGVSAARKLGVARSRGEWICFVDADDVLAPDALENLLHFADAGTDLVEGNFEFFRDGTELPAFPRENSSTPKLSYEVDAVGYAVGNGKCGVRGFKKGFFPAPWAKIIRRTLLTDDVLNVPAEIVYGEDTIFLFRLSARGLRRAKKIDACVIAIRRRADSASFAPIRYDETYSLKMYDEMISAVQPFPEKERKEALASIAFHAKGHLAGVLKYSRISNYAKCCAILRPAAEKFSLNPRSMFFFYLLFKLHLINFFKPALSVYSAISKPLKS